MTSFRQPLYTIVRQCSSYELTHPSQGILSCCACRREWDGRLGLRRLSVMGKCLTPLLGHPEVSVVLFADDIVLGRRVPSPGQPAKVRPKDLLARRTVSSQQMCTHGLQYARSVIYWLDTGRVEARRFVSEPTLIYGVPV